MHSRLKGLSRARIGVICAAEVDVSMPLVLKVLAGGEVKSSQGRRVLKWCQEHGYPIDRPAPTPEKADELIAQLEAQEAARQGR